MAEFAIVGIAKKGHATQQMRKRDEQHTGQRYRESSGKQEDERREIIKGLLIRSSPRLRDAGRDKIGKTRLRQRVGGHSRSGIGPLSRVDKTPQVCQREEQTVNRIDAGKAITSVAREIAG